MPQLLLIAEIPFIPPSRIFPPLPLRSSSCVSIPQTCILHIVYTYSRLACGYRTRTTAITYRLFVYMCVFPSILTRRTRIAAMSKTRQVKIVFGFGTVLQGYLNVLLTRLKLNIILVPGSESVFFSPRIRKQPPAGRSPGRKDRALAVANRIGIERVR